MFNLYKVKVYKKMNLNGVDVISYLDNIIINVLPEGISFNKVNEFCTGEPLAFVNSMDDELNNDTDLIVFKSDIKKENRRKLSDDMLKYYIDSFEDSAFNKYISSPKEEKVMKKEID